MSQSPTPAQRGGAGCLPSTAAHEVALLPFDDVRERLERHPILLTHHINAKRVHACMVEMYDVGDTVARRARPPPIVDRTKRSRCCRAESVVSEDQSGHVCTACGLMQGAFLSTEMPYRYFAEDRYSGKADPSHWSRDIEDEEEGEGGAWPEVEQLRQCAFVYGASEAHVSQTQRRLEGYVARRKVSHRLAAAAAAWIITEHPDVFIDRRAGMVAADLPVAPYPCRHCHEGFHVKRDLRFHVSRCPKACTAASKAGSH